MLLMEFNGTGTTLDFESKKIVVETARTSAQHINCKGKHFRLWKFMLVTIQGSPIIVDCLIRMAPGQNLIFRRLKMNLVVSE